MSYHLTDAEKRLGENVTTAEFIAIYQTRTGLRQGSNGDGFRWPESVASQPASVSKGVAQGSPESAVHVEGA